MEIPARIGDFPVERILGAGAVGSVYLCDHPRLGLPVAVKLLADRDPDVLERFRREAELMSRIRHPAVVEVLEAGSCELGPYLVLEYCAGQDLASLLKERGALPPLEACRLVGAIARGVEAAHAQGVIHRDLKPQNVLVRAEGPKVTDFGVARRAEGSALEALTQSGVILGTPSYMAPEQARSARAADARSDVYALGVILHECLTGRQPFPGNSALEVLNRVVEGRAEPLPPEVPQDLAEVVRCAMALDPADRYTSAEYLADALAELDQPEPSRAPSVTKLAAAGFLLGALVVGSLVAYEVSRASAVEAPATSPQVSPSDVARSSPRPAALAYRSQAYFEEKQAAWRVGSASELEAQVKRGSRAAQVALALRYLGGLGGVARDEPRATELLAEEAERGNGDALFVLAVIERRQRGARERELLATAARAGSHDAAQELASSEEEFAAARALALENAERGDPSGIRFLADAAYAKGDQEETLSWVERGVAIGLPSSYALRARLERQRTNGDLAQAAADYARAAAEDHPEGLCGAARSAVFGWGGEKDLEAAERYLNRVRAARPLWARFEEAHLFWVRRDKEPWLKLVGELLDLEHDRVPPFLWGDLGLLLTEVASSLPDDRRSSVLTGASKFLSRSQPYRSLDPKVCFRTGLAIKAGQIPLPAGRDREVHAAKLFARAASLRYAKGTYAIGYAMILGQGVPQNVPRGLELVEVAAEAGVNVAWGRLGDLYYGALPDHIEVDLEKARAYYRRGAEAGRARSCFKLSAMLLNSGRDEEGARWAKRAAELGSGPGEVSYMNCLLRGRGVEADPQRAISALRRLAESEPLAADLLVGVYREGLGVAADQAESERYAALAESLRARGKK